MSASLVGSEMCIRDRFPKTATVAEPPYPCHGRSCGAARSARGTGWVPVSYTHLTLPTICSV
eukprot:12777729-Alexandrium_andersonii.AAC.1